MGPSITVTLSTFLSYITGGYTIEITAKGSALQNQSVCFGVYQCMGFLNGHPVYKQDGGQNYIYFYENQGRWLVGPKVDCSYAWIRSKVEDLDSSHSSGFPDSLSESDSESMGSNLSLASKASKFTKNRRSLTGSRSSFTSLVIQNKTPDQFGKGWEYSTSLLDDEMGDEEDTWMADDKTLEVKALKGS